jgi:hypothetical protein
MKKIKFVQRLLILVLVAANFTLLLTSYRVNLQEILLFNLSLGLLYVALRSAIDLVRSNGLQEQLDEQM